MSDGGLPSSAPSGVAGVLTAIGGVITAAGVAVGYVLEHRPRRRAAALVLSDEQTTQIAKAVAAELDVPPVDARRVRAKPAKRSRT